MGSTQIFQDIKIKNISFKKWFEDDGIIPLILHDCLFLYFSHSFQTAFAFYSFQYGIQPAFRDLFCFGQSPGCFYSNQPGRQTIHYTLPGFNLT